jgi:hypothetical protein
MEPSKGEGLAPGQVEVFEEEEHIRGGGRRAHRGEAVDGGCEVSILWECTNTAEEWLERGW